jgi:hypothetical protein
MSKERKKYGLETFTYLHQQAFNDEEWTRRKLEAKYTTSLMNSRTMKHNLYVVIGIHVWVNYRPISKTPHSQEEAETR